MNLINNIRTFILEDEFRMTFLNNKLNIVNYKAITNFESNFITIKHDNGEIKIKGENLYVSRLLIDEILIEGNIKNIEIGWFMNRKLYELFKSKIKLKITGKNINRFINKLIAKQVSLLKVNRAKHNEIIITIYKEDFQKVVDLKSFYEINIIDASGAIKIRKLIKINQLMIILIILGIISIFFLSSTIFTVNVVHTDKQLIELILKELENHNIKKGKFKKRFSEIETIKKEILNKHKDKIEWLEIENVGTKYIIKVEERRIQIPKEEKSNRHIIASKSAIVKNIIALNGQIVKPLNSFVNPGDIIISGNILLYEEIKKSVAAEGKVYGEVWYTVTTSYPLVYNESKSTGNTRIVYGLKFLNKYLTFNLKSYKEKNIIDDVLLKNNVFPISIVKQKQIEMKGISFILTEEEAEEKAIETSKKKIEAKLKADEYIIESKQLKKSLKNSKIEVVMFYTVYENITAYQTITNKEWYHD